MPRRTGASKDSIERVWAREVLNFRGNPTVEAEVRLADGSWGRGVAPTGISTGSSEARQLFDGDAKRFGGQGVLKAVENVRTVLAPALIGMSASLQEEVDARLRELDGTPDKGRLGANAVLAVSLATAQAAAASHKLPLFRYLGGDGPFHLPVPAYDMFQGGEHAENSADLQEYLVIPAGLPSFQEAVQAGHAVYRALAQALKRRGHAVRQSVGPLSAPLKSNEEGVELMAEAIEAAGYKLGVEVFIGLDAAASHLYHDGRYVLASEKRSLTAGQLADLWEKWIGAYPIISIEDAMAEEDWEGWQAVTRRIGDKVQLVGDDLFTTNPARLRKGIDLGAANAVLVKPNQVGTLSETLETMRTAHAAGYAAMLSTRSGEADDTTIADLAVQATAGQIKAGPVAGPSMLKYNRLLRIQEELGAEAQYAGRTVFRALR